MALVLGNNKMATVGVVLFVFITLFCSLSTTKAQKNVVELDEENWKQILEHEWMVEFYAPWCPACKGLESTWKDFAGRGPDFGIKVGKVDVTTSPGLSGRFMVTALPTIFHVLNGEFRQYKGTRDKDSFINFVQEKKWQSVDPIPGWKSPNSIQMTLVSSFFKLSQFLRTIHTRLMEEYGLPTWGSYIIFAVGTIILGALLGLLLVCVIDMVYPPKPVISHRSSEDEPKRADKDSDIELDDDDIRDDLLDDASQSGSESDTKEHNEKDVVEESGSGDQNLSSPDIKKRKPRKAD